MEMQQIAVGCGGTPTHGPIPRNAEIWKATGGGRWFWTFTGLIGLTAYAGVWYGGWIGAAIAAFTAWEARFPTIALEFIAIGIIAGYEGWAWGLLRVILWILGIISYLGIAALILGTIWASYKINYVKCCGDFADDTSRGVYIC
jgi:hypothetical protein